MISVRNLRVTGFSREFNEVFWEVAPTNEDLQEYEFIIERSEAEAGPFEAITGPLVDRYYIRDNDVPAISLTRTLFYRVMVRHLLSGRTEYTSTADRWGEHDLVAEEIVRLEALLFKEYIGSVCWLFPRRTFGQRCPQCWDEDLDKVTDSQCPTCFKTGFSGGYHYPIQFFAQIDPSGATEVVSPSDHHHQGAISFRCSSSPDIKPLDLFIDHKNRRMRVTSAHGTTRLGVIVHQEIQAVILQPGSIEDLVPLKVDTEALQFSAWRNFTNPMNPEAVGVIPDDALSSLLGPYGY